MKCGNTADLREKEVINLCDGSKLGCAGDFEFDICTGRITALIIICETGFLGFGKKYELVIPWERIQCIGDDTILVKLEPGECEHFTRECGKKKKKKC